MGAVANHTEEQQQQNHHNSQPEASQEAVDALLEAARYDDIDDVTSLASSGISLDSKDSMGRTALHMAAGNGHLRIVEYLMSKGVVPLLLVKYLCVHGISAGADLGFEDLNACNEDKNTPLHWACLNGHVEVVKKLILAGATLSILNSYERTPVDEAISQGKMDVIEAINTAVTQMELAGVSVSS